MSNSINPEAAQPTATLAFEQSDRNPTVTKWGGRAAGGGQINAPASSKSMVTQPGPAISLMQDCRTMTQETSRMGLRTTLNERDSLGR
ncbi:MAG TPA: hypothetical protein VFF64_15205 [Candidatus Eremiobacteraceae bacterium]|nr:hypothetical protein [Candidatus Eremiobacteraceae bacterium]